MLPAFLYSLLRLLLDLFLVRCRSDASLRSKVLLLRHQLRVLQPQTRRPRWQGFACCWQRSAAGIQIAAYAEMMISTGLSHVQGVSRASAPVGRENSMGRRGFESGRGRTLLWMTSGTSAGDIETIAPLSGGGIG